MNTSATGGVLQPNVSPAPLEGMALQIFLQNWIAPLTSLDPSMVRPRWQAEPADIPQAGDAWMAIGITPDRDSDTYPYIESSKDGLSQTLQRQETLPIMCSAYDLGSTGLADGIVTLLRDNLAIQQNLEPLLGAGFVLAYVEGITPAPTLKNSRWQYRMDFKFMLRRQINRTYQVLSVLEMKGTVTTDSGLKTFPISAGPVTEE